MGALGCREAGSESSLVGVLPWLDGREDARHRQVLRMGLAAACAAHLAVLSLPRLAEPAPAPLRAVTFEPFELAPTRPPARRTPPPPTPPVPAPPARLATPVPVPAALAPEPLAPPVEAPLALSLPVPADPGVLVFPAPPPSADVVVDWHAGIAAPERIGGPLPAYTECARRIHLEGVVELDAVIGVDGRLRELTPVTRLPCGLTEAAVQAVSAWSFRPARRGDTPLAVRYRLQLRFELR